MQRTSNNARRGAPPKALRDNNKGVYGDKSSNLFKKFFARPKKRRGRGRPKKSKTPANIAQSRAKKPRDAKQANARSPPAVVAVAPPELDPELIAATKVKKTRRNWAKGKLKLIMDRAVSSFLHKNDLFHAGESLVGFAARLNIPRSVFRRFYLAASSSAASGGGDGDGKRGRGRAALLSLEKQDLIIDSVAALDVAGEPATNGHIVDMVLTAMGHKQRTTDKKLHKRAADVWRKTIHPRGRRLGKLTGNVKVQAGTVGRTAAGAEALQRHWHTTIDGALRKLRELNADVPDFESIIDHFVSNLDEECVMASGYNKTVVGSKSKVKHDDTRGTSRISITLVRCGNAAGNSGPTFFLLAGKHRKPAYTPAFLEEFGAAPQSDIVMTPSAFMTDDAWSELIPRLAKGLRMMPVVADHPGAWILLSLDGYKSHTKPTKCLPLLAQHKILLIVENRDSSTLNQVRGLMSAAIDLDV